MKTLEFTALGLAVLLALAIITSHGINEAIATCDTNDFEVACP